MMDFFFFCVLLNPINPGVDIYMIFTLPQKHVPREMAAKSSSKPAAIHETI
jgi:hypothetical protein